MSQISTLVLSDGRKRIRSPSKPFQSAAFGTKSASSKYDSSEAEEPDSRQTTKLMEDDNDSLKGVTKFDQRFFLEDKSAYDMDVETDKVDKDQFVSGGERIVDSTQSTPYITDTGIRTQQEHLESYTKEAGVSHSTFLKKHTISRDQTAASDFEVQRLLATVKALNHHTDANHTDTGPSWRDFRQQGKSPFTSRPRDKYKEALEQTHQGQAVLGRNQWLIERVPLPTREPPIPINAQSSGTMHTSDLASSRGGITAQNHSQSDLIDQLLKRIDDLEGIGNRKESDVVRGSTLHRFKVLHVLDQKIKCLEEPTWAFEQNNRVRLKPESPLIDLDTYLRRNEDVSFLVYKLYESPSVSVADLAERFETGVLPAPEPTHEYIDIRSEELKVALNAFMGSTGAVDDKFSHGSNIHAPFMFWYQGRSDYKAMSRLRPKYRVQLEFLTNWIETNYAARYDQFDEMTSRGRISHAFVEHMYSTGDVVVHKDHEKTTAYRLQGRVPLNRQSKGRSHNAYAFDNALEFKPGESRESSRQPAWTWTIPCWTIVYDGKFYS
ncbi:hypothetical protein OPT61_g9290 [Boeremia exigua]|uniref:Uncharacterized protein n=1 Tax=Boeremia exigua TaxID=749465 RepID=A0ACC2HVV1_9PLEO|nr:hypothetical protein OPT61_g9290 [Boeremia exigua]